MLFKSERLNYRLWHKSDLGSGLKLWGNEDVMKYIEPVLTRKQVVLSIDKGVEHYKKYGVQHFAMVLKDTNQIIGCCGLSVEDFENGIYEFVVHILPEFQKQQYGYEAGKAVLEFSRSLEINKIIATCHLENIRSKCLLIKLGFEYIDDLWFEDTDRFEAYYEMRKS